VPETQGDRRRKIRPEIWFNAVGSACPRCGRRIDGKHHVTARAHVVMRQFCPEHGHRAVLVSTDADWFARHEQMAALLPPRAERTVPEGVCCYPDLALGELSDSETARRILWLAQASPGSLNVRVPAAAPAPPATAALSRLLGQARAAGHACVTVQARARWLADAGAAAALAACDALALVDAADRDLPELLERHPSLSVVLVSRLAAPADLSARERSERPSGTDLHRPRPEAAPAAGPAPPGLSAALASAFGRFAAHSAIVSWEVVPEGEIAEAWWTQDHHPARGPAGEPSNGPVPEPGPVPATLSEAMPLVVAAAGGSGLARDDFFPAPRFHPPGSALAVVRCGGAPGPIESLAGPLAPRRAIDLVAAGPQAAAATDPRVLAVRAIWGHAGRMHPRMLASLVAQALAEEGALVAPRHDRDVERAGGADAAAPPAGGGRIKTIVVHSPLSRSNFDRNRLLRACPVPREARECLSSACVYLGNGRR
jgi:uncharacterized radical SAM superfamily Fe-S cluster-containing enzyme